MCDRAVISNGLGRHVIVHRPESAPVLEISTGSRSMVFPFQTIQQIRDLQDALDLLILEGGLQ